MWPPKTNYFYLWRHRDTLNNSRKNRTFSQKYVLVISRSRKSDISKMLEKTSADKSWRSVLNFLEHLEYGINIFQKTWHEIYMKFQHIWSISSSKTLLLFLKLWSQETLKPRSQEIVSGNCCPCLIINDAGRPAKQLGGLGRMGAPK